MTDACSLWAYLSLSPKMQFQREHNDMHSQRVFGFASIGDLSELAMVIGSNDGCGVVSVREC